MWQAQMLSEAARRTAYALIGSLGGTSVELRLPAPPVAGDAGEELGLRTPLFQPKALSPVTVRRSASDVELLVPADALEDTLAIAGEGAVRTTVESLAGVLVGDELFRCVDTEVIGMAGRVCLYRLLLQPHGTETV